MQIATIYLFRLLYQRRITLSYTTSTRAFQQARPLLFIKLTTFLDFFNALSSCILKSVTTDPCPPKNNLDTTSSVWPATTSACTCSTETFAEAEYLYPFITTKAAEASGDSSSISNTENSNEPKFADVRNYVTSECARLLPSRDDVEDEANFHQQGSVEE